MTLTAAEPAEGYRGYALDMFTNDSKAIPIAYGTGFVYDENTGGHFEWVVRFRSPPGGMSGYGFGHIRENALADAYNKIDEYLKERNVNTTS